MENDSKKNSDLTRVDFGEDILESPSSAPTILEPEKTTILEELQRGKIFLDEKLFEDAKKVFRKILRNDSLNQTAIEALDQIQKIEIQELLADSGRKNYSLSQAAQVEEVKTVIDKLDKELNLGLEKNQLRVIPHLFQTENELQKYSADILNSVKHLDSQNIIDIGIAFLEMGIYSVAQNLFEQVAKDERYQVEAMYLLGMALIYGGKAIEATIRLEPLAREMSLTENQKSDFLYLMGLAFESLADYKKAKEFYRRVYILNPRYKDVIEKIK